MVSGVFSKGLKVCGSYWKGRKKNERRVLFTDPIPRRWVTLSRWDLGLQVDHYWYESIRVRRTPNLSSYRRGSRRTRGTVSVTLGHDPLSRSSLTVPTGTVIFDTHEVSRRTGVFLSGQVSSSPTVSVPDMYTTDESVQGVHFLLRNVRSVSRVFLSVILV